jgi:hypothetical protein
MNFFPRFAATPVAPDTPPLRDPSPDIPIMLTALDVAAMFHCTPRTLRRWRRDGTLLPVRMGRVPLYRAEDVQRRIVEQLQAAMPSVKKHLRSTSEETAAETTQHRSYDRVPSVNTVVSKTSPASWLVTGLDCSCLRPHISGEVP